MAVLLLAGAAAGIATLFSMGSVDLIRGDCNGNPRVMHVAYHNPFSKSKPTDYSDDAVNETTDCP